MRAVTINVIDHSQQRYSTLGDWFYEGEALKILVSETSDWRMNMLVAWHEFAESLLCKARGISEEAVTAWDIGHPDAEEPGAIVGAPYLREHFFATTVERLLAAELGVDWAEYEERLAAL